jgi:hypothetical protein
MLGVNSIPQPEATVSQAAAIDQTAPQTGVDAGINYVVKTGKKPVTYLPEMGVRETRRDGEFELRTKHIANARDSVHSNDIEREGFVLAEHETAVTDFYDDDEVRRVYYPELEELVKTQTGAKRVFVFDHTIRAASAATQAERSVRDPVHIAHNDYTEKSGPQRVRDWLPDEAEELLKGRFAVVQVWRPIKDPVEQQPLAICDASSIAPGDLVETDLVYKDRVGEVLQLAHNPEHRWSYMPNMTRDEALVFKRYDSVREGVSRFTAHTAFNDPTTKPDARERVSIEARTLVFF